MDKRELAIKYCRELASCKPAEFFKDVTSYEKGIHFILVYLFESKHEVLAKELAKSLRVSTARIAVLLNKMEARDLIQRIHSDKDARVTIVKLTEKGKNHILSKFEVGIERMIELIEEIGEEDLKEFIRLSKKIKLCVERIM